MNPTKEAFLRFLHIAVPRYGEYPHRHGNHIDPEFLLSGPEWEVWQEQEASEQLRSDLTRIVNKQTKGARKIGVMLSGGFDSSVLAHLLKGSREKIICYVSEFPEFEKINEVDFAIQMAEHCRLKLKTVKVNYPLFKELSQQLFQHANSPVLTWTAVTQLAISRQAQADGCELLVSGLGSDELFGGFSQMGALYGQFKVKGDESYWQSLLSDDREDLDLFRGNVSVFSYEDLHTLFPHEFEKDIIEKPLIDYYRTHHHHHPSLDISPFMSLLEKIQRLDQVLLPDFNLPEAITGIPLVHPYLEDCLWHNFLKLPIGLRWKFNHDTHLKYFYNGFSGIDKYLLRYTFQDDIPAQIQTRKPMGYTAPFAWWITNKEYLQEVKNEVLECSHFNQMGLKQEQIKPLFNFEQYAPGTHNQWDEPFKIWMLYSFAKWFNQLDQSK